MSRTYTLMNPFIVGNNSFTGQGKNSAQAAQEIYAKLSDNYNNNVPLSHFTLARDLKGGGVNLSHFRVTEIKNGKDQVKYNIKKIKVSPENEKEFFEAHTEFVNKYNAAKQNGGKKKNYKNKHSKKHRSKSSESSSSSSISDSSSIRTEKLYNRVHRYSLHVDPDPITFWWYRPILYSDVIDPFIPTFYSLNKPYVQVSIKRYII